MTGERVLLVCGGNEMFAYRTAMCLADEAFVTSVATPQRLSSLRTSRYVDSVFHVPSHVLESDGDDAGAALAAVVANFGADVVFPTDLLALRACHVASDHLDVPIVVSPSSAVVDVCHDKGRFAEHLSTLGCSQPGLHQVILRSTQIDDLVIDRPMIVKPIDGDGGIGVKRVTSSDDLARHLRSGDPGSKPPLLLQEYVPGADIDCSFYAEGGKILASLVQTRRYLGDPQLEFVVDDRVVGLCESIVRSLDYGGLGHIDLRIDERDDSVKVIELNPRVWGSIHCAAFAGANFAVLAVRRALGQAFVALEPTLGRLHDPGVDMPAVLRSLFGRSVVAPPGLNLAEQRMFVSKHADPIPMTAMRMKASVWGLLERSKGRGTAAAPTRQR